MLNRTSKYIYILFLISVMVSAQETIKQPPKSNSINATNASPGRVNINAGSRNLMTISEQIDQNGTSFGVMNLKQATDDPSEPDSIKNRMWKDPGEALIYGGDFQAMGSINASSNITANYFTADNKVTTNAFRMITGVALGKDLQSDASGNTSWVTLFGGGSGSINELSDGKATLNAGNLYLGSGAGINDDSLGSGDPSYNTGVGINTLSTNGLVASQRGEKNTAFGYEALKNLDNNNGNENTAMGYQSHFYNSSGTQNTALGADAMKGYSGGDENIAVGFQAMQGGSNAANGEQNIEIGVGTLSNNISGDNNVAIGYKAGFAHTGDDQLFIQNRNISTYKPLIWGRFAPGITRLQVNGENESTTSLFYLNGSAGGTSSWSSSSDRRLKKNISTIPNALKKVLQLRGVNYEWKEPEYHRDGKQMGFIAQESLKIIHEVIDSKSEFMSMEYAPITALLVQAVKEQ